MGVRLHRPLLLGLAACASLSSARVLEVGPGKAYTLPSQAALAAKDGDTVAFSPVVFTGDAATWSASNLVLRGTAAYAHLKAQGVNAGGKGTWVIKGNNTVLENLEFSEASVPDQNGAGIRQEGDNLTVRNCFFHDNENGILAGDAANSDILIERTEFARNGFGDGYTHNMYINHVKSFTLRYCYSHHAKVGHNIKTRALRNFILCNRSLDGTDGTGSYELDLPNGGYTVIAGNVFQQGAATENPTLVSYGEEGLTNTGSAVQIINNTFVNDRPSGGTFIVLAAATPSARVMNNLFVGPGTLISGFIPDSSANLATQSPGFLDRAGFDYRLAAASPAIDKGADPGRLDGMALLPDMQFLPPGQVLPRPVKGPPDIGAFEYDGSAGIGYRQASARSAKGQVQDIGVLYGGGRLFFGAIDPVDGLGRTVRHSLKSE
ncbi:MAG: hypothetical protein JWO30_616 [Fibrobacteres bacterium]|nr:hypothetical protein [Fibrobacterota bacterium]